MSDDELIERRGAGHDERRRDVGAPPCPPRLLQRRSDRARITRQHRRIRVARCPRPTPTHWWTLPRESIHPADPARSRAVLPADSRRDSRAPRQDFRPPKQCFRASKSTTLRSSSRARANTIVCTSDCRKRAAMSRDCSTTDRRWPMAGSINGGLIRIQCFSPRGAPSSSINVIGSSISRSANCCGLAMVAEARMNCGDDP